MSLFYRKEEIEEGIFVVTHFGSHNWRDNEPFDGIEITDEPFDMTNFFNFQQQDGEWINLVPPPASLELI
jgi:hypothetical protein